MPRSCDCKDCKCNDCTCHSLNLTDCNTEKDIIRKVKKYYSNVKCKKPVCCTQNNWYNNTNNDTTTPNTPVCTERTAILTENVYMALDNNGNSIIEVLNNQISTTLREKLTINVSTNLINDIAIPGQEIIYTITVSNNNLEPVLAALAGSTNALGSFTNLSNGCLLNNNNLQAFACLLGCIETGTTITATFVLDDIATPGTHTTTFIGIATGSIVSITYTFTIEEPMDLVPGTGTDEPVVVLTLKQTLASPEE